MNRCDAINALNELDIDSRAFGLVSFVSGLAAAAKSRTFSWSFALTLRRLNSKVSETLAGLHDVIEGKQPARNVSAEPPTNAQILNAADSFEYCYRAIDYIYESARRAGFTNRTLTAGSLASLKKYNEELLDIAVWLEDLGHPKEVDSLFDRAKKAADSGEVYDLSEV
jgi:hypothetical protein